MLCGGPGFSIVGLTRIGSNNINLMDHFIGPNINRLAYIDS